jgi:hypothetical protein
MCSLFLLQAQAAAAAAEAERSELASQLARAEAGARDAVHRHAATAAAWQKLNEELMGGGSYDRD